MNIKTRLDKILGSGKVKENFNLSPYLTLRTQTIAEFYFAAETRSDLINAKKACIELKIPFLLIGGGSNLAIISKKISGLTVRNQYLHKKITETNDKYLLTVSSGYSMTKLIQEIAEAGYAGLEFHSGLPGTVGGALYMNSKWTKPVSYVGDTLISAVLIDSSGKLKEVDRKYFNFAYDQSTLQKSGDIVLEATFSLTKKDPAQILESSKFARQYRRKTQPHGVFTSGCFFRNVNGESAGKLIDRAGLKNTRVGQFHVSDLHANFIINDGNGEPEDLKKLLTIIKSRVREKFGIELQEEVLII